LNKADYKNKRPYTIVLLAMPKKAKQNKRKRNYYIPPIDNRNEIAAILSSLIVAAITPENIREAIKNENKKYDTIKRKSKRLNK
jgi:hypothetical protein